MTSIPIQLPDDSPVSGTRITVEPDGTLRVGNMLTRREFDEIERIRNSRYYLVRNDGGEFNETRPCIRCGAGRYPTQPHRYFTLMCTERPWRGLEDGLRMWLKATGPSTRKDVLLAGLDRGLQDYSKVHPVTAGHLAPPEPDMVNWYSMLARIKDRRPPIFPPELLSLVGNRI
jgi:hypothetical protein